MEELIELPEEIEIELGDLTDEETEMLFSTVLEEDGSLSLNRKIVKNIPKKTKSADGKYYLAGTLIGYEDKYNRPVYFEKGAHEEALPFWRGKKLFAFHEEKMYPLGKFEEAFMDGPNVKFLAWTDDKNTYDSVKSGKINEFSGKIIPKKIKYNRIKKKFGVIQYRPKEGSIVNFQGYKPAKVEIVGTNKDKVRKLLMNNKEEAILLQKDEDTQIEQQFDEKDKKILELENKLKIIEFREKHPDAINIDKVIEFMLKYEASEQDAEEMIIVEEVKKIIEEPPIEEVKEGKLGEDRTNEEVPRVTEEISEPPKEKTDLEKFRETLDERVEHARRRGYK